MSSVGITVTGPDGEPLGSWRTHENGEHEMMMRSEDGEHGIRIQREVTDEAIIDRAIPIGPVAAQFAGVEGYAIVRDPDGKPLLGFDAAEVIPPQKDVTNALAIEAEQDLAEAEPFALDRDFADEDKAMAQAYMAVWNHYQCAYNATQHRRSTDLTGQQIMDLLAAIMGREVSLGGTDDPPFSKLLWEAGQERSRLLDRIMRVHEISDVNAASIASQQRLIQELSTHATRGKEAMDVLRNLSVWFGGITNGSPEELAASIKSLARGENRVQEGTPQ